MVYKTLQSLKEQVLRDIKLNSKRYYEVDPSILSIVPPANQFGTRFFGKTNLDHIKTYKGVIALTKSREECDGEFINEPLCRFNENWTKLEVVCGCSRSLSAFLNKKTIHIKIKTAKQLAVDAAIKMAFEENKVRSSQSAYSNVMNIYSRATTGTSHKDLAKMFSMSVSSIYGLVGFAKNPVNRICLRYALIGQGAVGALASKIYTAVCRDIVKADFLCSLATTINRDSKPLRSYYKGSFVKLLLYTADYLATHTKIPTNQDIYEYLYDIENKNVASLKMKERISKLTYQEMRAEYKLLHVRLKEASALAGKNLTKV